MQRSFIFTVLFCFYLFFFEPLNHTHAQIQAPYHERYYTISNPDGVFGFQEYASPTFQQEIISASDTSIVRVRTAIRAPEHMKSHYPVSELIGDFSPYLQPTRWIQSDDPRIISVAEQIRHDHPTENLHDLVFQVMLWSARHLQYGDPSGIHDAVYALENRVVNCIGYAHLPAAMLRHLGIPARVVRTFVYRYPGFTRHYLLEVYYPEDNVWLTFEPQTRNNRQFNGPLVFFERQQDGQWDYHSTFRYPDAWYLDGRASHGELAFSPQGDLYIPGPQGVARLSYSAGRWEAVEFIKGKADEGFRENARFIAFNEDGSRMIAGAPGLFEDYFGWEPSVAGFAEVFRYTSSGWESAAVLTAPDGHPGDQFGFSVAASGNRYLVGAPLHSGRGSEAGAAFLFEEDPRSGIIGKATTLQAAATIAEDQFGGRVALRGIQAFVSSHRRFCHHGIIKTC